MGLLLNAVSTILRTEVYNHAGDWASRNRTLSRAESGEGGSLFNIDRSPYFLPIYDVAESGKYSWIVVVCGSQMGKTEFLLNRCGYKLDVKPTPIMLVQPNKDLAKRFSKARVSKILLNSVASFLFRGLSSPALYSSQAL